MARTMRLKAKRTSRPRSPGSFATVRRVPVGKGIFVRGVASAGGPDRIVAVSVWAGLRWVAVQSWWKDQTASGVYNGNAAYMAEIAGKLRRAGIQFWVWGWPYPEQASAFASEVGGHARLGSGAFLDLEGDEWQGEGSIAAAHSLVSKMRASLAGRGLGLTSYGRPSNFPAFPWTTAQLYDFGAPQLYLGHRTYGAGYQAAGVEDYEALGFRAVVPLLGAYDMDPGEMAAVYANTPRPAGAVGWWDMANADAEPSRWYAIQGAPI
jgi:hypothetical protein